MSFPSDVSSTWPLTAASRAQAMASFMADRLQTRRGESEDFSSVRFAGVCNCP